MGLLLIYTLLALFFAGGDAKPVKGHDCKSLVLNAYQSMGKIGGEETVSQLEYKTVAYYLEPGTEVEKRHAVVTRLEVQGQRMIAENDEVLLATDERTQLLVNKKRRQIMLSDALPAHLRSASPLGTLREELIRDSEELSCAAEGDKKIRVVRLRVAERFRNTSGMKEITFRINMDTGKLAGFEAAYQEGHALLRQHIVITRFEEKTATKPAVRRPEELIVESGRSLKAAYKGFKVTDTRGE